MVTEHNSEGMHRDVKKFDVKRTMTESGAMMKNDTPVVRNEVRCWGR